MDEMEASLMKIINDDELYLECEIPSRWQIVSDVLASKLDAEPLNEQIWWGLK